MEQELILYKLIETLKQRGFKHPTIDKSEWWKDPNKRNEAIENCYHFPLIFNQDFAKFCWGTNVTLQEGLQDWMYHFARLAICNDRLWYLDTEFLQK